MDEEPDESPPPSAELERTELLFALRRAIDEALSPRQRVAILAELQGMPSAVLADQLGSNTNAVYKLYHDARKKLRQALEDAGFSARDLEELNRSESR